MPELPEVETVRRGLAPAMVGARITTLEQRRPDLRFPLPERFAARLAGRTIVTLGRRAKYLLAEIDSGETLVMHLGMSGRFTIAAMEGGEAAPGAFALPAGGNPAHDHVVFHLSSGARVTYNDARRFGFMLLIDSAALSRHPLFADLGPEPLGNGISADYLASRAQGKRTDLKAFLLDQRVVAGLGNIYVSEALFRAGLDPRKPARRLARKGGASTPAAERLVAEVRAVLDAALAAGGSTLRDWRHADGQLGYFQHTFMVYDRAGQHCLRAGCDGAVRRIVQAGRSTYFCPKCQR